MFLNRLMFVVAVGGISTQAATMVSSTSPGPSAYMALGGSFERIVVQPWTQLETYANVQIAAEVFITDGTSPHVGSAWLTNSVGAGATNANVIATADFTFPVAATSSAAVPMTVMFGGLTLGPGTYYLILTGDTVNANARGWRANAAATVVTANGITTEKQRFADNLGFGVLNTGFVPASTFVEPSSNALLLFTVTGDLANVPEPSGMAMVGLVGLLLVGFVRRVAAG
ncbi:MAG: hypothetical protein HY820_25220 [Acidobacteria bacterium]|nr:hypothetical protein [Acidobacteriota bacterium]